LNESPHPLPPPDEPSPGGEAVQRAVASTPAPSTRRQAVQWSSYALLLSLLVGGLLRFYASVGDLWLDEVWSLQTVAARCHSWSDVFTSLHVQNNHYLSTLWFYAMGTGQWFVLYRLPSIIAGVATVALAAHLATRYSKAASLFTAALTATSYLLVHYASEARGYSMLTMLALLCIVLALSHAKRPTLRTAILLNLTLSLGLLSQLLFAVFAGLLGLWLALGPRAEGAPGKRLSQLAWACACGVLPAITLITLFVVDISKIPPGGTDPSDLLSVIFTSLSLTLGGPHDGWLSLAFAAVTLTLTLALLIGPLRKRDDFATLTLTLLAGLFVLLPLLSSPTHTPLAVRYFLVCVPLVLIVLSGLLGELWQACRFKRALAVAALLVYFILNGVHLSWLLRDGHGQYTQAVTYLGSQSSHGVALQISGDHDFRLTTMLEFYQTALPANLNVEYRHRNDIPRSGTEWIITHALEPAPPPAASMTIYGKTYRLQAVFPASPLSGFTWYVYRKAR
jgi:hypothetical protein